MEAPLGKRSTLVAGKLHQPRISYHGQYSRYNSVVVCSAVGSFLSVLSLRFCAVGVE